MRRGVGRVQGQRPRYELRRLLVLAALIGDDTQKMHGVDVVRIGRHYRAIGHLRIVQASCLMMPQGDMKRMSVADSSIFANCARTH